MVIVDGRGEIILVNSQTETLFGYTRAELLGKPVEILMPDRFRGTHPAHRAEYFAEARVRPMGAGLDLYGHAEGSPGVPDRDQPQSARDRGGDARQQLDPRHHRSQASGG